MKNQKAAYRYAKSLIGLAIEQDELEGAREDAKSILGVCKDNPDLRLLFKSPVVNADKKASILKEIFEKGTGKLMMSFINLMVKKGREALLPETLEAFVRQYKDHKDIETAIITTAIPLDDEMRANLKKVLEENSDAESMVLNETVDEDIIGGIIVRIGDKQVDESIRSKIKILEQEFSKNPYIKAI